MNTTICHRLPTDLAHILSLVSLLVVQPAFSCASFFRLRHSVVQEVVVTVDTSGTAEVGREVRIALGVVAMVAMGVVSVAVKDTVVRSDGDSIEVEDSSVMPAMLVVVLGTV